MKGPMFIIEKKIPLVNQINSLVQKYYVQPQGVVVMLHPSVVEAHKRELENFLLAGIELYPTRVVLPTSFWIGTREDERGNPQYLRAPREGTLTAS